MSLFPTQFNGSRLREAREARALTGAMLADMTGVSAGAISHYEHGRSTPTPAMVAKISNILNVAPHFFSDTGEEHDNILLHWRSRDKAKNVIRQRAKRRYAWLRRIVQSLERHVSLPPVNIIQSTLSSDPKQITDPMIEQTATELRRSWGLGDGPISHMVRLVENNGCIVVRNELGDHVDAFSNWRYGDSERCFVVLGTDKQSAVRSRHSTAHEVGHAVLHRDVTEKISLERETHRLMESQAERFAGALLMPESTFPNEVYSPSLDALLPLKKRWGVSIQAMMKRLLDLNIIDDAKYKQLNINISRRRWRTREPYDDTIEIEGPKLLRRCIDSALERGLIDADRFVTMTGLYQADIESLLGLPEGYLGNREEEQPYKFPNVS